MIKKDAKQFTGTFLYPLLLKAKQQISGETGGGRKRETLRKKER